MKFNKNVIALVAASLVHPSLTQNTTWCGKNFMANQSVVPPGGQFVMPTLSAQPLLAFRCAPVFRPYLVEEAQTAAFVVDTPIVYENIMGAQPISMTGSPSSFGTLDVTITVGSVKTTACVPLNATDFQMPMDISQLTAQKTAYNVTCSATYSTSSSAQPQNFNTSASLLYLPDTNGSVTKTDLRTGALWVRPANGTGGPFAPFIPQGFYINFDQYLAKNLSMIDQLKADGFNTLHPIPPYDDLAVFQQVVNKSMEAQMYIVYDMRSNYQNLTAVAQQVNAYASIPNLLNWETAHEPDGNSDPQNAALDAYNLIYQMDGYHPISIVLNCQDYNFAPYVKGADIVLQDAYPIGINATWSPVWHTECTPDFGHCGCDNCNGTIEDVRARVMSFKDRLNILGFDRTKSVWTTPQAFGSSAYWNATPNGQQWGAMGFTSFANGAMGSKSYQYPTTSGNITSIEGTAINLVPAISPYIPSFMGNPNVTHIQYYQQSVDAGLWYNGTAYLLLISNLASTNANIFVAWNEIGLGTTIKNATTQVHRLFSVYIPKNITWQTGLTLQYQGVGAYIVTV